MNDVVLIGNGPSVKKYEYGDLIDSYKTVVRFNWYHIDGYEKHVGTKTDIWFTSIYDPIRAKKKYDHVIEHSWEWKHRNDKVYQKLKDAEIPAAKTFHKLIFDIKQYMDAKIGLRRSVMVPGGEYNVWSTGALAAWWMLSHPQHNYEKLLLCEVSKRIPSFDKIDMFGFDWWDMTKGDYYHHGDSQAVGQNHKPKFELEFFRFLWEDDRIHDLNPESDFHHAPLSND